MKHLLALILLLGGLTAAFAVQPGEILQDPVLEARARALSAELRCLVCQNQSIDDSDAPLARDLRLLLREQLQAGKTDQQAIGFIVERYGEYVLLKPRFTGRTLLLWGLPFAVLGVGFLALFLRRRPMGDGERPLTAQEREALAKIER